MEKLNIRYQSAIERTLEMLLEFWDEFLKKKVDLGRLFQLGTLINQQFLWIKQAMRTLTDKNPARLEVIYPKTREPQRRSEISLANRAPAHLAVMTG